MPIQVMWEVSKGEGGESPMWLDKPEAEMLVKQGVKPAKRFETIAAFDASDVRKALTAPARAARTETLTQVGANSAAIGMLVADLIASFKSGAAAGGDTRTLTGKQAKLALSLGVKPISVRDGKFTFSAKQLDNAAKNLSPSEQAMAELQNWYEAGN